MFNSLKKVAAQNKIATGLVGLGLGTVSQAAVAFDDAAQKFTGTIDMSAYNSAIPITVTVIGLVIAVSIGIKVLKSAKSA